MADPRTDFRRSAIRQHGAGPDHAGRGGAWPVALGLKPDGKKEIIDFCLAPAESAAQWGLFLGDLIRRGLGGRCLEMICSDGGSGLVDALTVAFPDVPL